jgi:hypothetical protein
MRPGLARITVAYKAGARNKTMGEERRDRTSTNWVLGGLRLMLFLISAGGLLVCIIGIINIQGHQPQVRRVEMEDLWLFTAGAVGLGLNIVYLLAAPPRQKSGRTRRMVSLWLDAKESELRNRASRGICVPPPAVSSATAPPPPPI